MFSIIKRTLSGGENSEAKKTKLERQDPVTEISLTDDQISEILPDAPNWGKSLLCCLHVDLLKIQDSIDTVKKESVGAETFNILEQKVNYIENENAILKSANEDLNRLKQKT